MTTVADVLSIILISVMGIGSLVLLLAVVIWFIRSSGSKSKDWIPMGRVKLVGNATVQIFCQDTKNYWVQYVISVPKQTVKHVGPFNSYALAQEFAEQI